MKSNTFCVVFFVLFVFVFCLVYGGVQHMCTLCYLFVVLSLFLKCPRATVIPSSATFPNSRDFRRFPITLFCSTIVLSQLHSSYSDTIFQYISQFQRFSFSYYFFVVLLLFLKYTRATVIPTSGTFPNYEDFRYRRLDL